MIQTVPFQLDVRLRSLPIGRRLALVLGAILALSIFGATMAYVSLERLGRDVDSMISEDLATERLLVDWLRFTSNGIQRATAIAKSSDPSLADYFAGASAESIKQTNVIQGDIARRMEGPDEQARFERIGKLRVRYLAAREEISERRKNGDDAAARQAFEERFLPTSRDYVTEVQGLVDVQRAQVDERAKRARTLRHEAEIHLIASTSVALVVAIALAWLVSRSIANPLREAQDMAQAIGSLDLSRGDHNAAGSDETTRLLGSMATMRGSLAQSIQSVREVAGNVSTLSAEIAAGNKDLSSRTEEAAASLEETASSMEEVTATVRQTADSVAVARQLSATATELAQQGGQAVAEVIMTMADIDRDAKRIGEIIAVVDGIALQTNILALNASVEAARAGTQGRGFAVVAGEVRALASRSAEAAKEIKTLIAQSVEQAHKGAHLASGAGKTMESIVGGVRQVTEIVAEISTAAAEQSDGLAQINSAVGELDRVTQQNAALVEQATHATESLHAYAGRLREAVAMFRLP